MHLKKGARITVDADCKQEAILRKAQRDSHAFRLWQQEYMDSHSCAASRAIERGRIQVSGRLEEHCGYCGGGHFFYRDVKVPAAARLVNRNGRLAVVSSFERIPVRGPCRHPGYRLTFQCLDCRYSCHLLLKAKTHSAVQGHKVKLVDLRWHSQ